MTISVHLSVPERGKIPLRQRRLRAAATTEFGVALDAISLSQNRVAKLFDVTPRSIRRWRHGDRPVPVGVAVLMRLLIAGAVSLAEVEQAAVPAPARTNGGAEPAAVPVPAQTNGGARSELPAPLLVTPAPTALARVEAATLTDPNVSTAERVVALGLRACRWPHGDPRRSDFHFCSAITEKGPYCKRHSTMAYLAPRSQQAPTGGQKPSNLAAWPPRTGTGRPSHDVDGPRATPVALSV